MDLKQIWREHFYFLMLVTLIVGIFLFVIGIFGLVQDYAPPGIDTLIDRIGYWYFWCLIFGFFAVVGGGFYYIDGRKKIKQFEELLESNSKAKFIRSCAEIEKTLWHLPSSYSVRYQEKCKEYKIKR